MPGNPPRDEIRDKVAEYASEIPELAVPIPALTFMLFPPDMTDIRALGLAETCGAEAMIHPFAA